MADIAVTDKNFDTEVIRSSIPVFVDFWATWCGPCQMQIPILEEVAQEFEGKVKVAKVNVDDNPQTASKYGIMSIPTIILFDKGNTVKQMIGMQSKETLVEEINLLLKQK
jgi:thioredoxin 1